MEQELNIDDLKFFVQIGIEPWEKVIKQSVKVKLSFYTQEIIDYVIVKYFIKSFIYNNHYPYIENLSQDIMTKLKKNFSVNKIKVEVVKVNALYQCSPKVTLYDCG